MWKRISRRDLNELVLLPERTRYLAWTIRNGHHEMDQVIMNQRQGGGRGNSRLTEPRLKPRTCRPKSQTGQRSIIVMPTRLFRSSQQSYQLARRSEIAHISLPRAKSHKIETHLPPRISLNLAGSHLQLLRLAIGGYLHKHPEHYPSIPSRVTFHDQKLLLAESDLPLWHRRRLKMDLRRWKSRSRIYLQLPTRRRSQLKKMMLYVPLTPVSINADE